MVERDTRPLRSAMPAHLEPILDRRGAELSRLLSATFDEVMDSAPDRVPAELENDALSLMAQFIAMGGMVLTATMADRKGVPIGIAHTITLADVAARWAVLADGLAALRTLAAGATRQ